MHMRVLCQDRYMYTSLHNYYRIIITYHYTVTLESPFEQKQMVDTGMYILSLDGSCKIEIIL